jgi:hypothetical protein
MYNRNLLTNVYFFKVFVSRSALVGGFNYPLKADRLSESTRNG